MSDNNGKPIHRGGFNPLRVQRDNGKPVRPTPVVPQILEAPLASQAHGFTEVRIIGVCGGGTNAVNRMVEAGVQGVEFISVNTDAQALAMSHALRKINIGGKSTRGLGAGGDPTSGERAAEISEDALYEAVSGADMVFITAGMGGGTGTGASPVIAEIARRERALTVGVVTTPFGFEGQRRRRLAEEGVAKLREKVDALIVIPNDRVLEMADRQMAIVEAFRMADDVLRHGVQGITDLVTLTGVINLDFADVRSIMAGAGTALMAIGEAKGEHRAMQAAHEAISSPLLDTSIAGARGVLLNVTGGPDLTLSEVTEAANAIAEAVDPAANIIFGAVIHPKAQETFRLTVIATGLPGNTRPVERPRPAPTPAPRDRDEEYTRPRTPQRQPQEHSPADYDTDLDLPAFLRRRRQP